MLTVIKFITRMITKLENLTKRKGDVFRICVVSNDTVCDRKKCTLEYPDFHNRTRDFSPSSLTYLS